MRVYLLAAIGLLSAGNCIASTPPPYPQLLPKLSQSEYPQSYRWEIIRQVHELPQPPAIPAEAQELANEGYELYTHANPDHGPDDYERAAAAYWRASLIAPWVAAYYFDRALALQQAAKEGNSSNARDAILSYHWYLVADPRATDVNLILRRIGDLEGYAGITSSESIGWVPLAWATSWNDVEAVRSLLESGANVNAMSDLPAGEKMTLLGVASSQGALEIVKLLIARGAQVDATDGQGYTALYWAAVGGKLPVGKYLVAHGANANQLSMDPASHTLLGIAASNGDLDVVKYLVSVGANVSLIDHAEALPPLYIAIKKNHPDIVQFLISAGADVNHGFGGLWGATPLIFAVGYDNLSMLQLLISEHAKVDAPDSVNNTALYYAARAGQVDVVRYLIAQGADINWFPHNDSFSVIAIAASEGNIDVIKTLLDAGANVNSPGGETPLTAAAFDGQLDTVEYLLSRHAKVDGENTDGATALVRAVEGGHVDIAKYLVANGADVNFKSEDGDTLLMAAAFSGKLDCVKYLVSIGANVNAQSADGRTAVDYANSQNHGDVAAYLTSQDGETGQAVNSGAMDVTSLGFLLLMILLGVRRAFVSKR